MGLDQHIIRFYHDSITDEWFKNPQDEGVYFGNFYALDNWMKKNCNDSIETGFKYIVVTRSKWEELLSLANEILDSYESGKDCLDMPCRETILLAREKLPGAEWRSTENTPGYYVNLKKLKGVLEASIPQYMDETHVRRYKPVVCESDADTIRKNINEYQRLEGQKTDYIAKFVKDYPDTDSPDFFDDLCKASEKWDNDNNMKELQDPFKNTLVLHRGECSDGETIGYFAY